MMSFRPLTALVVMLCSQIAPVLLAQDSTPAPASAEAAAPASASETHPVQLSPGVQDVLKLGSAHVSAEAITAFINNSGRTYHLSVSEILYLREQGMSDHVLTAMLSAGQNVTAVAAQAAPQPAPQPVQQLAPQPATTGTTADWVNSSPQPAPAAPQPATQFAPAYDAAAPVYAQPSPVYVYQAPSYGYYDPWPYYWGYPSVSFGFGFGRGYYGGYHGGGYHGGGFHGGGGGQR
jgi:uncharacterized membrane protein YgcG